MSAVLSRCRTHTCWVQIVERRWAANNTRQGTASPPLRVGVGGKKER
jgi:hypothetical protein